MPERNVEIILIFISDDFHNSFVDSLTDRQTDIIK
jgi:hypothetical protein